MPKKLFGTDGVRGHANIYPMTPEIIMRLAISAGHHFKNGDHVHRVIIGKDTRLSGYMVEPALVSGFIAVGMDVMLVGPMPTPAVSMLTRSLRADLGVVISASHNPYYDNGIKFFGPDGFKLTDDIEKKIESKVTGDQSSMLVEPKGMGRAKRYEDAPGRYIEFIKNTFPRSLRLDGLRLVVDCANGAAYRVAPTVFYELGAEVIPIGVDPDGCNINDGCGATAPSSLIDAVREHKADLGIALDGDADRVILVDEKGQLIDGDQILAVIAKSWRKDGRLRGDHIVATTMSNLGLETYLQEELGINLMRTAVGDRQVTKHMREHQCNVGGEQSGHIILSNYARTGDGLVAALQVLAVIVESGKPASEVTHLFTPVPQILRSIRISGDPLESSDFQSKISKTQESLGTMGRLIVRKSGTEPLLRLMAEGKDENQLNQLIDELVAIIQKEGFVATK